MTGRIATCLGTLLIPGFVFAADCSDLEAFAVSQTVPKMADKMAECSTSRILGGDTSFDCFWTFDYRSRQATELFQTLQEQLSDCRDDALHKEAGSVNHPDSFEQITGRVEGVPVSVSLKDKGGLNKTLVVLRGVVP